MDTITIFWIVAGIITLLAILLFFYFLTNHKYRSENPSYQTPAQVKHYEKMRDKLTIIDAKKDAKQPVEEEEEEEYEEGESGGMFMQIAVSAIGVGVVLMVGYMVLNQVTDALKQTTSPALNSTVTNLTSTTFAGFGLISIGVIVMAAFGLINIFRD